MLIASYEVKASDGRFRVPAELQRAMGQIDRQLVWSLEGWESLGVLRPAKVFDRNLEEALARSAYEPLSRQARAIREWFFCNSHEFELDANARLPLFPAAVARGGDPKGQLVLVCVGGHVTLVTAHRWNTFRTLGLSEQLLTRMDPSLRFAAPIVGADLGQALAETVVAKLFGAAAGLAAAPHQGRRLELEVAGMLQAADVGVVELTQPSQDRGIDLILHLRRGTASNLMYVQCKSGSSKVTVREVRELIGVVGRDGASGGLMVATADATDVAREEARISRVPLSVVQTQQLAAWLETQSPTPSGS
jgi:HJR/Mrr/RecB family endonuclease